MTTLLLHFVQNQMLKYLVPVFDNTEDEVLNSF